MNNPNIYKMMLNKYLVNQEEKRISETKPIIKEPVIKEIKDNDEVITLKKRLLELENKENKIIEKKVINTNNKLKGENPSERTTKMRNAKLTKRQKDENKLLEGCMDKDITELKKEQKDAMKKVRLLKKFTHDIQNNNDI